MITFSKKEQKIIKQLDELKQKSGSHSPSIITIADKIPEINVLVDACFLSNPYATDVFLEYFKRELIDTNKLRDFLEFYPSQNEIIAELLGSHLKIDHRNILVGNGATELIQAILHNFTSGKVLVNIPTFSPYYEFVKNKEKIIYNTLTEENNFKLDISSYIKLVKKEKPDTVVIINPNNPDGSYITYNEMKHLIEEIKDVENIIIDESFIHFAYEDTTFELKTVTGLIGQYPHLIVLKSMSKDFGIAGIRAGYVVMDKRKVEKLLQNGYLWNSNGLAEYFFRLYARKDFLKEYEKARVKYIQETHTFFSALSHIPGLKVIPSMANFALVKLKDDTKASILAQKLLISQGIHVRNCDDKIGLVGEYIRIASRTRQENKLIIKALRNIFDKNYEYKREKEISIV